MTRYILAFNVYSCFPSRAVISLEIIISIINIHNFVKEVSYRKIIVLQIIVLSIDQVLIIIVQSRQNLGKVYTASEYIF